MSDEENIDPGQPAAGSPAQTKPLSATSMEVHHHPDLHHKRKKLREYFLEFLMIFLAVTLGFFAESLRENLSESAHAKEYALMLLKDVVKDTVELHKTKVAYLENIGSLDTLQELRRTKKDKISDVEFYYYCYPAFLAGQVPFNDATLQQVKNSGSLRYFRSPRLKEKIDEYDNIIKNFALRQEFELNWVPILHSFYTSLFDYDVKTVVEQKIRQHYSLDSLEKEHYVFLNRDPVELNRFLNYCDYRKGTWQTRIARNIDPTLQVAAQLISLLKNEYGFTDNE